jgi:hypothetical protein
LNQTGELGTPVYEALEIMLNESFGFPVDLYASGVLFNARVTGQAPFCEHACTLFHLFRKACQGHRAFTGSGVTSFVLLESVKTLGDSCFAECIHLQESTFPKNSGLTEIPSVAFAGAGLIAVLVRSYISVIHDKVF